VWREAVLRSVVSYLKVLLLVGMKNKGRNSLHGSSGMMSLPLLLLAAIVAGFLLLFYITHAGDSSLFDNTGATHHKFGIAPPKGSTVISSIRAGPNQDGAKSIELATTQRLTAKPTQQPVRSVSHEEVGESSATLVQHMLAGHPFHSLSPAQRSSMSLEDHFVYLQKQDVCKNVPIFTSMANVFSDLYWQL